MVTLVLFFSAMASSTGMAATTKGPDNGGYTGTDETLFSFVDLAGAGAAGVLTGSDDGTAVLTLPFPFTFYGTTYSHVCVSTNGAMYFIGDAPSDLAQCNAVNDFANRDLTSTTPPGDRPGVFPFWSDLTFGQAGAGSVLYQSVGQTGSRRFVIQWNNAFPLGSQSPVNFEVLLIEGGTQVLFQYKTVTLGAISANNGGQATVGIRASGAVDNGKQIAWSFNAPVLADSVALLFVGSRLVPTVTATGGTFTYNALPHAGSGSATDIGGKPLEPAAVFSYEGTNGTNYGPTAVAPTNAGTYLLTVTFNGNADYTEQTATDPLTILQRPVTITADAKSKLEGSDDPPLTYKVTSGSLAGSDTFGGSLTRDVGETVGAYPIRQGTVSLSSNYLLGYVSANLTITPRVSLPFTTYKQGDWGSKPKDSNVGALLAASFSQVYAGGSVRIGNTKTLTFTSAAGIEQFLPANGAPRVLQISAVNPTDPVGGSLGGQVLSLRLNVDFSVAGKTRPGFGALRIVSGPLAPMNLTVDQLLTIANNVLGGTAAPPAGLSLGSFNVVLDAVNSNYANGTVDNGYLAP
jgi:hypothetical protein